MSPLTQEVHSPPQPPQQQHGEAHPQLRLPMLATARPERQILRVADLQDLLNLSRTTIWRLRQAGEFPQPIRLSANAVGWHAHDIYEWLAKRPPA